MKLSKSVLTGLIATGSLVLFSSTVLAGENGSSVKSNVDIEYITNTDTTDPKDPTDPDNKPKPNPDNPGTDEEGPLSIDYVTNIKFGQQKPSGNDVSYFATLDKVINQDDSEKPVPAYVQVTDNRGSNAGWSLSVKQDEQFKNASNKKLGKAELRLHNGTPNSANSADMAPVAEKTVTLKLDSAGNGINSKVMAAANGKGAGTWTNMFGKDVEEAVSSVELFVPGGTQIEKGAYSTTLTWTLSADPAQ